MTLAVFPVRFKQMERNYYLNEISNALKIHPVVVILGPRQCGKTTLSREFAKLVNKNEKNIAESEQIHYFDLEDPADLMLLENSKHLLSQLKGLIIIDEIQKKPDFFPLLRVIVDAQNSDKKFLILGSASRDLIRQSSETLAGRIEYIELAPFGYKETKGDLNELWLRGGYPRSYLAEDSDASLRWLKNYILTFLERDLIDFGINLPPLQMYRFWMMLSHYHGNICNMSEIGKSLGIAHTTISKYVDILCGTYIARLLQPWRENISKRQVKMPKFYIRDSGILHSMLEINKMNQLVLSPKVGSSFEGFAIEQIIRKNNARAEQCFFWATHAGAELDLLIVNPKGRIGFEIKYSDVPKISKSAHVALNDLNLDHLFVIYPGDKTYQIHDKITVTSLEYYLS